MGLRLNTVAASLLIASLGAPAHATETRGFLVNWFYVAQYFDTEKRDCPHGENPGPEMFFKRELLRIGLPEKEVDDYILNFSNLSKSLPTSRVVQMRGRVDGQPADVYADPTTVPDPNTFLVEGPYGYGFNLDGKDKPGDFIDPESGLRGIDNQLYRVTGCTRGTRPLSPTEYAPLYVSYWNIVAEVMPAMLIEIGGIDDDQNDDDITVGIYRAQERMTVDSTGRAMGGISYRVDPSSRWRNLVRGKIRNGVITTDPAELNIATDPFVMPEFKFKKARLALQIKPDGNLHGRLGAYHAWFPYYWSYGQATWSMEATNNIDLPGFYYALRKAADADPDLKTGENTSLSTAYQIDAVPAFVIHDDGPGPLARDGR